MSDKKTSTVQSLEEAFQALDESDLELTQSLREILILQQPILHHEAERLKQVYGAENPRVGQLEDALRLNRQHIKELEIQLEVAKIKVPDVAEEDALIHGRVVDESHRGYPGLTIVMETEDGKLLRKYGTIKTDTSGYYALPLAAEVVTKLSEGKLTPAYFAVRNRKGKALYRQFEPLTIQADERRVQDVVIPRAELGMVHTPPAPSKKPRKKGSKPPQKKKKDPKKEDDQKT